jgi:hypothetical protein
MQFEESECKHCLLLLYLPMRALLSGYTTNHKSSLIAAFKIFFFSSKSERGQLCGDIEFAGYPENEAGPVPLLLDLHIAHERFGSRNKRQKFVNNVCNPRIQIRDD